MKQLRWRIYYDDGPTFSSEDGDPVDAPAYGVICIVACDPAVNRIILNGWDWYYYDGQEWWGGDIYGLLDRLCHRIPTFAVCQGRTVRNEDYGRIMGLADKDPDFPPRGGRLKREAPPWAR